MKEPEISQSAPRAPRYRYFSNPPATVSLRLADLASQIPEAARLPGFRADHTVELSCEEIFTGPTPKLRFSRLAEIAREYIRIDGLPDNTVKLPVAQLALAYRFVNGREVIEEAPPPPTVKPPEPRDEFASKAEESKVSEGKMATDATEKAMLASSGEIATGEAKEPVIPASRPDTLSSVPPPEASPPAQVPDASSLPAEEKRGEAPSKPAEIPPKQEAASQAAPEDAEESKPAAHEEWRPITVFPVLRRKVTEPQVKPPVAPLRPVIEPRPPREPFVPLEPSVKPAQDPQAESSEALAKEPVTPAPVPEAVLVDAEHPAKPNRTVGIVDQDALQAVFMTEEMLSVDRVVELCGDLPGIKSCVLAHGAAVLASHNVPESIDLVSLSAHALEMLAAMRQSAARMGVGAVPAVTIHAEKGPITFFHQDDLCLLVMHKDRGFVPGVREKLQKVVEHLARSAPELAAGDSRFGWGSKKPST